MIYTAVHSLDVRNTQWDTAHLFEHLFINAWYTHLASNGYSDALFGWMLGDTFEEYIFIDSGFYDKEVAALFDDYVHTSRDFSLAEINSSLADIGAEDKIEVTISDLQHLQQELSELSRSFANNSSSNIEASSDLLHSKANAAIYRDIDIITSGNDLTPDEQKVFLRLRTILIELISRALSNIYVHYDRGHTPLAKQGNDMAFLTKNTLKTNQGTLNQLAAELESAIHDFSVDAHWPEIAQHFAAYSHESLWKSAVIELYRDTGIVTTTEEITSLATKETIQSILQKISIRANPHDNANDKWIR